jgi:hypothetical protein
VKAISLALMLGIAGSLCAQTATPPDAPAPQTKHEQSRGKSRKSRLPTLFPSVDTANAGRLSPKQKFQLFLFNTANPYPLVVAAAQAGISQAENSNPGYGQGGEGYAKRLGAAYADTASTQFFGSFLYPVLFHQDPRYFRKATGSGGSRMGYAISRVFVTRTDSGHSAPNVSFWMASATSAVISNTYYPAGDRSAIDAAERAAIGFGTQAGFNLVKEFWPEIKHKLFKKK